MRRPSADAFDKVRSLVAEQAERSCPLCEGAHDQWTCPDRETRERKACDGCGYVRLVRVTRRWVPPQPSGAPGRVQVAWNGRCAACDHDESARRYDGAAAKHRRQAAEIRARRASRAEAKNSSTRRTKQGTKG